MDGTGDPRRALLERVAGVSARAPREEYEVSGLSFGSATLRRSPVHGRWSSLTLRLTPDAVARCGPAAATQAATVLYPLEYWQAQGASLDEDDDVSPGLHGLLVDYALLSHPEWLTGPDTDDVPIGTAAADALQNLRDVLARVTLMAAKCPVCPAPPRTPFARSGGPSTYDAEIAQMLRSMGVSISGLAQPAAPPPPDCPHASLRREAFKVLSAAFPEVACEAALVLVAAPTLDPPRFVLRPMILRQMLGDWLMLRAPSGYLRPVGPEPAAVPPRPTAEDDLLAPAQRSALAFAARSWGLAGPLARFVPPRNDVDAPPPTRPVAAEPLDVVLLWPEGIAKPPPRLPPPPAEPAAPKPAALKAPRKRAMVTPTPVAPVAPPRPATPGPATPTPGQELMTAELRALGYTAETIKRLVQAGTLERTGFGWFRWKG